MSPATELTPPTNIIVDDLGRPGLRRMTILSFWIKPGEEEPRFVRLSRDPETRRNPEVIQ